MKSKRAFIRLQKIIGICIVLSLPFPGGATVDIGLAESLRKALEAQGWQAQETHDGSLIYRRSSVQAKPQEGQPVMKTLGGEDLNRALQERGWQMEWSPNGSLLLKPQVRRPIKSDEVSNAVQPETETTPAASRPEQPGFEYWRIERQEDGSLHFYPLAAAAGRPDRTQQVTTLGACKGLEILDSTVLLPVDQWTEAKALAQGWLNETGLSDLQVGKIRKVLGVYLISLVDRSPPFHLRHQLAIIATDGRVILLE